MYFPQGTYATIATVCVIIFFGVLLGTMVSFMRQKKQLFKPGDPVDAWVMQRELMHISNQTMPQLPQVNKTTLLYWALMLEEMSETGDALYDVLSRHWQQGDSRASAYSPRSLICIQMHSDVHMLKHASTRLRRVLETFNEFELEVTRKEAKALLDGTTDNAVVNAGFAIGSGFPGPEAYLEVVSSNLSKKNPETGMIEKLSDGKWIKGVDYKEPDLDKVLEVQQIKLADAGQFFVDDSETQARDRALA